MVESSLAKAIRITIKTRVALSNVNITRDILS